MIEVTLLGPQAVRRSDGREFSSLTSQPKRFALLAFLAVAAGSHYRRDSIVAMFWPELDQFAARRALRNTLYHLREALGDGVIVTRGDDEVAIDPRMLTSDVTALDAAFAAGRFEETVDRYRGEFLAGVHFADAGEAFEDWLSRERAKVTDTVMRAFRALVDRERTTGDVARAAYWAQRATALAPIDEGWLRQTMSLLSESGDRGGALRFYETFVRRLAAEFDAKPTAETDALARRIRDGTRPATIHASQPRAETQTETRTEPVVATPVRSRRRAVVWVAIACVALALIGSTAAWIELERRQKAVDAPPRVLVSVFENRTGDPHLQVLGRMAQDWLTQGVLRMRRVEVVDPRVVVVQSRAADGGGVDPMTLARRTGAAMVVSGSYYKTGDTLLFQAALMDVSNGRILRAVGPIVATTQKPVGALDELRSRVMTALASAVEMGGSDAFVARGEIPSFEAYQSYVEAYDAFWHSDGKRAEALFEQAARRDTTFSVAAVAAAMVASNYHHCALVDSLVQALGAGARQLARLDRLSLDIAVARCRGHNEEMLRLTLERADLEPRTSSLQLPAAAAALWALRPARALSILERLDPDTDLGWTTDSTHFAYWSSRTEALHLLGRYAEELAIASRATRDAPLSRDWMRGRALAALDRRAEVLALVDTITTLTAETANDIGLAPFTDGRPEYTSTPGWVTLWIAKELDVHGDSLTAKKVAQRSVDWYHGRPADERSTPEERLIAAWALDLAGKPADAEQLLRGLLAEDSTNVDYIGTLGVIAAEGRRIPQADSVDRWLAAQRPERAGWSASFYRASEAARLGNDTDAVARLRVALDEGAWPLFLHLEPAFVALRARKDFQSLLAPRG